MNITGEITPPGDKSISHRSLIIGALAKGTTSIKGILESRDIMSTNNALVALGTQIKRDGDIYLINGDHLKEPCAIIDAGNSGTTARLLSGIAAGVDGVSIITGDNSLIKRPMQRVIKPLKQMGAIFMAREKRYLPMAIKGTRLKGISYRMPIASAQVKSAILLAGIKGMGTTEVREPIKSRDHTERMLKFFGAKVDIMETKVTISGGQTLKARDVVVPGDPSSAVFPAVWAATTTGSELLIKDVCVNPTRTGFIDVLKRMGADISIENPRDITGEKIGDILIKGHDLTSTTIEGPEIPHLIDEIPILAVAAALATGKTIIKDAKELRVKETDRISAMMKGFAALGAKVAEMEDGMIIDGPLELSAGAIETFGDHRIAMAFYILGKIADINIRLDNRECVDISYPGFFNAMERLG
ncbi:MAG: 3-phosphoshikimate 1-carboxyvinyltransferase [Thermodesulfobacteriota bacterium]|nr:3-phosphoshikimate 1-carboxyvinyltransferase [Thermodesulfobacteriota bacterium]